MKDLINFLIAAVLFITLAYFAVEALEREEFVEQAKASKRYEEMRYYGRHIPVWSNDGAEVSTGMNYYIHKKERGR